MKMLMEFRMPIEPFNSRVKDGTAGQILGKIMESLKPEAVYFNAVNGKRGGIMVIDLKDTSRIPHYAEPFFLNFDAEVSIIPCMTPEDLMKADLDKLGKTWG